MSSDFFSTTSFSGFSTLSILSVLFVARSTCSFTCAYSGPVELNEVLASLLRRRHRTLQLEGSSELCRTWLYTLHLSPRMTSNGAAGYYPFSSCIRTYANASFLSSMDRELSHRGRCPLAESYSCKTSRNLV